MPASGVINTIVGDTTRIGRMMDANSAAKRYAMMHRCPLVSVESILRVGIKLGGVQMAGVKTSGRNSVHASLYPNGHQCFKSGMSFGRTGALVFI